MGTGHLPSACLSLETGGPDVVSLLYELQTEAPPVGTLGPLWVLLLGLTNCTVSTCTETVPATDAK